MAFVVMSNGKTKTLSREQGLVIWDVLNGRTEPQDDKQRIFVEHIRRLYLNREYAPADYITMYPQGMDVASKEPERELAWYQK